MDVEETLNNVTPDQMAFALPQWLLQTMQKVNHMPEHFADKLGNKTIYEEEITSLPCPVCEGVGTLSLQEKCFSCDGSGIAYPDPEEASAPLMPTSCCIQ